MSQQLGPKSFCMYNHWWGQRTHRQAPLDARVPGSAERNILIQKLPVWSAISRFRPLLYCLASRYMFGACIWIHKHIIHVGRVCGRARVNNASEARRLVRICPAQKCTPAPWSVFSARSLYTRDGRTRNLFIVVGKKRLACMRIRRHVVVPAGRVILIGHWLYTRNNPGSLRDDGQRVCVDRKKWDCDFIFDGWKSWHGVVGRSVGSLAHWHC